MILDSFHQKLFLILEIVHLYTWLLKVQIQVQQADKLKVMLAVLVYKVNLVMLRKPKILILAFQALE